MLWPKKSSLCVWPNGFRIGARFWIHVDTKKSCRTITATFSMAMIFYLDKALSPCLPRNQVWKFSISDILCWSETSSKKTLMKSQTVSFCSYLCRTDFFSEFLDVVQNSASCLGTPLVLTFYTMHDRILIPKLIWKYYEVIEPWYLSRYSAGLRAGRSRFRDSIPGGGWEFFSSPPLPERLRSPPSLLSNGYQGLFPWR
jgi:hypothetical protein